MPLILFQVFNLNVKEPNINIPEQIKLSQKVGSNKTVYNFCAKLKALKEGGMEIYEIESIIKQANLPFGIELFILGRFSDLMELTYRGA